MFSGSSPGPPVSSPPSTTSKVQPTPLHEALKLKKLYDASLKDYLETNKNATQADLEKFKEQFVAQTRPAAATTPSSSSSKLPQQLLPVNRNLTGAFFDPYDEHSNVRPTVFLGRQQFSPPKVEVPTFDDNASMSSDGMSAAMTMQTSSKPLPTPTPTPPIETPIETPTATKPSVSVFTPPLWPFPSLQNKEGQQEHSGISLWPFGTTASSSSSSAAASVQPTIVTVDEIPAMTRIDLQPSTINIDNNNEQPSSPNLIIWPFSTARFAPVMPFTFGTVEVPVSRQVPPPAVGRTPTVDTSGGDGTATVPGTPSACSPRKQNRRDLNGYVDAESSYLDSSMAGFVANRELIDGRIKELESGAHSSDG